GDTERRRLRRALVSRGARARRGTSAGGRGAARREGGSAARGGKGRGPRRGREGAGAKARRVVGGLMGGATVSVGAGWMAPPYRWELKTAGTPVQLAAREAPGAEAWRPGGRGGGGRGAGGGGGLVGFLWEGAGGPKGPFWAGFWGLLGGFLNPGQ